MNGIVFDIKEMAVHDGPGIRTTVFLKGCPLRCKWCHNPEGLNREPQLMYRYNLCKGCGSCETSCSHEECQPFGRCLYICPENCMEICGKVSTAADLAKELKANAAILGDDFGGFTFSGGEPLFQPEFLFELMDELKGYHLCMETSGYASEDVFTKAVEKADMVIMDIKLADGALHKEYTGVDNALILSNFRYLQNSGKPYLIRTPLIQSITDTQENLGEIQKIIGSSLWEKLPENKAAGAKYKMLGMEYPLGDRYDK